MIETSLIRILSKAEHCMQAGHDNDAHALVERAQMLAISHPIHSELLFLFDYEAPCTRSRKKNESEVEFLEYLRDIDRSESHRYEHHIFRALDLLESNIARRFIHQSKQIKTLACSVRHLQNMLDAYRASVERIELLLN